VAVVVDTHALIWFLNNDRALSQSAAVAITRAEADGEAVVSVASFIDAWYVSQTTGAITTAEVERLVRLVQSRKSGFRTVSITPTIAVASNRIGKAVMPDPWDRLIVATARTRHLELVTKGQGHHQVAPGPHSVVKTISNACNLRMTVEVDRDRNWWRHDL
jgi:PIN domain nuclease of toxin-antitoxin system